MIIEVPQKRYQNYGFEDGKPVIKWTKWFDYRGKSRDPIQFKGFKGKDLKNEYRIIKREVKDE